MTHESSKGPAPQPTGRAARRMGGFIGLPALSTFLPMLILPLVSRIAGQEGWSSIGSAQLVGGMGAIAITFGWAMYGPPAVARTTSPYERRVLYRDSLVVRLAVSVAAVPLACLITALICNPAFLLDSVVMAAASAVAGLSPSWYFIGTGDPSSLAKYDVVPRMIATALAAGALLLVPWLWIYGLLLFLASLVGIVTFSRTLLSGTQEPLPARRPLPQLMRLTAHIALIDAVGNAYGSTPQPIATASLTSSASASFTSAEKLYRVGLSVVVVALGNAFQGWVLEPHAVNPRKRHLFAITAHVLVGTVGWAFLAFLGPWVTARFFGEDVPATGELSFWFGVAFLFISTSTPLMRNLLIPHGRGRFVFGATIASSVVGLSIMITGAVTGNGTAIAVGLAASEVVIVLILAVPALRLLPARRAVNATTSAPPPPAT